MGDNMQTHGKVLILCLCFIVNKMAGFRSFPSLHKFFFPLSLSLCFRQTFVNGQLRLEGKQEEGKGKCPFDPFQRYSSLMVGKCLSQVYCQREQSREILLNVQSAPTEEISLGDNLCSNLNLPQDPNTKCIAIVTRYLWDCDLLTPL